MDYPTHYMIEVGSIDNPGEWLLYELTQDPLVAMNVYRKELERNRNAPVPIPVRLTSPTAPASLRNYG